MLMHINTHSSTHGVQNTANSTTRSMRGPGAQAATAYNRVGGKSKNKPTNKKKSCEVVKSLSQTVYTLMHI